ncbi:alpha/beta hydrolase [Modicisalibacter tunisiensis]|uniref:alpha/beta fold hydrolase n=1 Tax=Modicisalibacter tunisiensis TaxID=390637 RepID=UPI001CCB75F2|nr:alpha/beta hydrolase [Modicisalibacter tunisiensis]MBZ9538869.1 alpha/beta hydrolase [Modicisalibacter tunisiensis]
MTPPTIHDTRVPTPRGRLFVRSWQPSGTVDAPPVVLFHESLGCIDLWRDFPARLADATGRRVIAYDRLGFGRSDPCPGRLPLDFIETEAQAAFAALHAHLALTHFIAFGHSVGGAMAAHVAMAFPEACRGLVTESAMSFVEARTLGGVREAKQAFTDPEQLARLVRYHGDRARWVLDAWVDTWLDEAFRDWDLAGVMSRVPCPLLALHGDRDEYGSSRHPERLVAHAAGPAMLRLLPGCGHVPHRERPEAVIEAVVAFLE